MHLLSFRKGWESERLAEYLLSRIAFLACPSTISDDVGLDFYCTLFQDVVADGHIYVQPRLSVAVQVKSAGDKTIDLTQKIDFLLKLELPYMLGVVNRSEQSITLHSGCYLPVLFAKEGRPTSLIAHLTPPVPGVLPGPYFSPPPAAVPFPAIATLRASDSPDVLTALRRSLVAHCSALAIQVRSFLGSDFLFEYDTTEIVYAGPESAKTFHKRLLGRLAEAIVNLDWLREHNQEPPPSERAAIEALIKELGKRHSLPLVLGNDCDSKA